MPKSILFHPLLIHFPIAFFFLEAMLVVLWLRRKEEMHEKFSYFTLKLTVALMPFVMFAGLKDANGLPPMVRTHFYFATALFVNSAARLLVRWKSGPGLWTGKYRTIYSVWVFLGLALTVLVGYLGGKVADG